MSLSKSLRKGELCDVLDRIPTGLVYSGYYSYDVCARAFPAFGGKEGFTESKGGEEMTVDRIATAAACVIGFGFFLAGVAILFFFMLIMIERMVQL